jgi:hypothetical protein
MMPGLAHPLITPLPGASDSTLAFPVTFCHA